MATILLYIWYNVVPTHLFEMRQFLGQVSVCAFKCQIVQVGGVTQGSAFKKENPSSSTSITPFVGDERASEIVSLARAKLRRGTSNNLCTAPY